jgi:hypothetical protein
MFEVEFKANLFLCTAGLTNRVEKRTKEKREKRGGEILIQPQRDTITKKHMDAYSMRYVQNEITQKGCPTRDTHES